MKIPGPVRSISSCLCVVALILAGCELSTPEDIRHSYLKLLENRYKQPTEPLDAAGVNVALLVSVNMDDRYKDYDYDPNYGNHMASYAQALMDLATEKLLPDAASIKRFYANAGGALQRDDIDSNDILVEIKEISNKSSDRTITVRVSEIKGNREVASATYADSYNQFSIFTDDFNVVFGKIGSAMRGKKLRNLISHPDPSDIASLLVFENVGKSRALEINQALVAANSITLPKLLQADKTVDLVDLQVKIEQAIVLLEHKSELAKEEAEAAVAEKGSPGDSREYALTLKERIAILKPMLQAIKEEISNRQK